MGPEHNPIRIDVVQMHVGETIAELLAKIRDRDRKSRKSDLASALVIRLPINCSYDEAGFKAENPFATLPELCGQRPGERWQSVFERTRDKSVHILASQDGEHFVSPNVNPHWPSDFLTPYGQAKILHDIRFREFEYVLENSRAVLIEQEKAVYKVPSGTVARSFIRVGNIQYDRDAIDAVVYWLLPLLRNCAGILTDTWSISSIAMAASRIASQYFGGSPCPVEVLRSYHDGSVRAQSQTSETVRHLVAECNDVDASHNKLLCLISASHTGRLAGRLQDLLEADHGEFEIEFRCLFSLSSDNKIECLHDLSQDFRFRLLTEAEQRMRRPITIDKQIYFPLGFSDVVMGLTKSIADKSFEFINSYKGFDIIRVHRDHNDNSQLRHHAIHLDTSKLFSTERFHTKLIEKLREFASPPAAIVHPYHTAGRELAELCRRYYASIGLVVTVLTHDTLDVPTTGKLSKSDQKILDILPKLQADDAILVLDDACITGRRMSQYQKFLRNRIEYRGKIRYLIGVARPESNAVWEEHKRVLPFGATGESDHSVDCVEFILLPHWDQSDCPWCKEYDFINESIDDDSLPEAMRARHRHLSNSRSVGLNENLFLELDKSSAMELGPVSLFVGRPATQAEAFAGVAAAIQHLREPNSRGPALGPRRFPIATVLNHNHYLKARWTDSVLRASFLRAAIAEELIYAAPEKEKIRTREMRSLMMQESINEYNVALEILLAAAMGQCGLAQDDEFLEKVQSHCTTGVVRFLLEEYSKRLID